MKMLLLLMQEYVNKYSVVYLLLHYFIIDYFKNGIFIQNELSQQLISVYPLSKYNGIITLGDVFYRITDNTTLLNRAKEDIKQSNLTQCNFNPTHLIIVTWDSYFYAFSVSIKHL